MTWLLGVIRRRDEDAKLKQLMTISVLAYGILACLSLPVLAFYAWGTPADTWAVAFFVSGLLSVAIAGLMGAFNLVQIRFFSS